MEKLSLQSANLNGIKVLMTTTRNELKKLNIPNSRLFTNDRGYGAIYYSEVTKNTYVGCCTVEPPDLIMATKEEIPDFVHKRELKTIKKVIDKLWENIRNSMIL